MAIHYLNCGSMRPYFPSVETGITCLLIETNHGPLLVDTGFGTRDYLNPTPRMNFILKAMRSKRDVNETAGQQIQRLGQKREDIRHIIQTHLHFDHAGGLSDFPDAHIHVHKPEHDHILVHRSWEYLPDHWKHSPKWILHEWKGEKWFDFEAIQLVGFEPEVWLVLLTGHTPGHIGVAVQDRQGWVFHAGDAIPYNAMLEDGPPDWLSCLILGDHIPHLREFNKSNPHVKLIGSHMSLDYYDKV